MSPLEQAAAELSALGITIDTGAFAQRHRSLADRRLADLMLAWACARHDGVAVAHFEKVYVPQAVRALRKLRLDDTLTDDVVSWLRFELFAREGTPLISTYSGRGELGAWVRSIAVHQALKRVKKQRREVSADEALELPAAEPGLQRLRGAYGPQLTRSLKAAFAALGPEQRNLLRQYLLDGLSIDALARLHAIHRATAARRVNAARSALVLAVTSRLVDELGLSRSAVGEVITLSNLDESLSGLLRRTSG